MATVPAPTTVMIGQIQYLIYSLSKTDTEFDEKITSPVTYLDLGVLEAVDASTLRHWAAELSSQDDAFQIDFLKVLLLSGSRGDSVLVGPEIEDVLTEWGTETVTYVSNPKINSGPYYLHDGQLYTVWKIHQDCQLAFTQALSRSVASNQHFQESPIVGNGYRAHGIAVPARSYYISINPWPKSVYREDHSSSHAPFDDSNLCHDNKRPLAGIRVAVKENYDVSGVRTSLCNRAYFETQSPARSNAFVVQAFLEAGAEVVGKTYMSAFAMKEHPMQSTDWQAAFNPRGDGYLITGGSSGGCASAIASYDWVDVAICSDTSGSARIPAFQTGVFGFRPSTHSISTKGLARAWEYFDTPAWFGRNLALFPKILHILTSRTEHLGKVSGTPARYITYITDFIPKNNTKQAEATERFLSRISDATGSVVNRLSLHHDWSISAPVDEKDLYQYLFYTMEHGWYYAAYHSFDDFRENYQATHGFMPYVTEVVRWYWSLGREVTHEQHEEILHRFSVFRKWFLSRYHQPNTVFLSHIDTVDPQYRDKYPGDANPAVPGLPPTFLSPILQAPELALPIDQMSYKSRITHRDEKIPIVISLMGLPNTDSDLMDWALEAFQKANQPTVVKTGKRAF